MPLARYFVGVTHHYQSQCPVRADASSTTARKGADYARDSGDVSVLDRPKDGL